MAALGRYLFLQQRVAQGVPLATIRREMGLIKTHKYVKKDSYYLSDKYLQYLANKRIKRLSAKRCNVCNKITQKSDGYCQKCFSIIKKHNIISRMEKQQNEGINFEEALSDEDAPSIFERLEKSIPRRIYFDLLDGLTDIQKQLVIAFTERFKNYPGFCPMAISVDVKTGAIYYFNKIIALTRTGESDR
jgi:hypothetical protein